MYQQGQQWQDGCNYNCECIDAMSGQYKCTEVCAKYDDLPAGCRMITDPYNPCCKKPYCPAINVPTPAPPGVSTMAPTPAPKTGCMYNGVRFSVGEHWNDGCDLQCVCEDEMTGFYRCNDRCRNYDAPEECTLVTDPRDACCKVPYCPTPTTPKPWYPGMVPTPAPGFTYAPGKEPTPAPGLTYAPGMFPTWVPGMVPTPAPGYTYAPNKLPTPAPGLTYAPGLYPTWVPGMQPTPAPGFTYAPNKIPTPAPGFTYPPGKFPTWVPGMVPTPAPGITYAPDKIPTPAPGSTYPPGMYPTWVPGMVPTPAPGYTYAPNKIPTPAPGFTYPPGQFPTYVPGMVPTPAPGVTYAPWKIPTPAPGRTYAPGMFPTWIPGMVPTPAPGVTYAPNKIPTPAPGSTYKPGYFPTYVPGMVPTPAPGFTYAPNKIPTPAPGSTYAPGKFPTWVPGMVPTPAPGYTYPPFLVPTPAPGMTYAPGKFPVITPSAYPTPAPGQTFPTWHPGMVPTPAPGQTYAPNLIPTPAPGRTYAPNQFPTYVPGMVPTPAPGKTFAPWLVPGFTPAPGSTYAPFQYPTWVPGMIPTPAPGVTYAPGKIPTPAPGQTYAPGFFPTWVPGMVPTPMPGMTFAPNKIPTPAPGSTYAPGKFPTWVPGMVPTPAPGVTYAPWKIPTPAPGSTYAPLKYPTWVPGMVPTPAPGVTYAPNMIPTPAPGYTFAPGQFPTYVPGMVPTPAPGMTYAPNMIPTPAPGSTYAPGKFPTYIPGVMVPTPAPGFTYAPNLIPTPAPGSTYAPGKYPTWIPGMVPTPAPGVTYAPNLIPTPAPGYTYAPGKFPTWVPGMVPTPAPGVTFAPNKIPTPAPGFTYPPGQFPTYVPGMVPTPAPGVTYAPWKIPTPAPGSTYPPGMFPTWVPGMVPTPAPGVTYAPNKIPTPAPGSTYRPGYFPTWVPGMVPTPAPGVTYAPNKIPTPAPGSTYAPGKFPTWVPGMVPTPAPGYTYPSFLVPTPAPGMTYAPGKFPTVLPSAYPTPAPGQTFPTWHPGMVPTPKPGQTYAPNLIPTPAPGITYAPNQFPTYIPGMVPTPAPGQTFAPWLVPGFTPAPGSTYPPFKYPTWVPGMIPTPAPGVTYAPGKIPTPAPGQTYAPGFYPTWVPGMVPTPMPGQTFAPNKIPTPAPGSTYAPGKFPTWVPGMVPTPAPGVTYAPNMIPTPAPGRTYAPGKYPTYVPGMVPTPAPGVTYAPNMIPTPAPGSTYAPGKFPTWVPGMVPTPAPGVTYAPNMIPTPGGGGTYAPLKYPTWVPGMVPTPAPGVTYSPEKIPTPHPGYTYAPGKFPTYVPGMVPTPAPGMTYAPNMIPTPAPGFTYAPGKFPTYIPGLMVPTPAPGVTYAPNMIPTPAPGSTYPPGMFPTYVPGMVPTPAPGVTYAPNMIPTPAPGRTYAPGQYPTYVPGMVPTPAPGVTYAPNMIPTPAPGRTYAPGKYPTYVPGMVPTPAPGVTYAPNMIPTPAPGSTYAPGKFPTWVPGMVPTPAPGYTYPPFLVPTPAPGMTYAPGKFPVITPSAYPTPAPGQTFPTWHPGMVPTPKPGQTYAPNLIPTPAPGITYAPNQFPTYIPGMVPTPAPGQTFAPWLIPGFTPAPGSTYPPFKYPTWVPGMIPTPAPGVTYAPGKIPTPAPGQTYAPGFYPTWVPGMVPTPMPGQTFAPNKIPTPAPGSTYAPGKFPTWVPGMVPTPAPGVTYAPNMIPTPGGGGTYAPLKYPTWVPGMVPTPAPGVTYAPNMIPTPAPGYTYAPGKFPTYVPGMVPTPAPGYTYAPNMIPTPAPGMTYAPGKYPTWVPGMIPTPAPGVTFAPWYVPTPAPHSTYAPGKFPTWVPGMIPTPAPGVTYAPNMIPTPAPGYTYAPGKYPTYVPGMVPTPAPGRTFAPNMIPTPAPGFTYAPGKFPTYIPGLMVPTPAPGFTYAPNMIPTPAPGYTYAPGKYPTWVPGMVPTPAPGYTYSPDKVPTPAPGATYAPGKFPTPAPNPYPVPTALPGTFQGSGVNGNKSGCVHYGVVYNAGQTWKDGCKYDCECLDDHTGRYECKERCPLFLNIPSYCRLVVDPNDACCKIPVCQKPTPAPVPTPSPQPQPTPAPVPGVSTPQPQSVSGVPGVISGSGTQPTPKIGSFTSKPSEGCVMNGVHYVAGQSWYNGCDQKCVCEDGKTHFYRCYDRCAKFPTIPTGCKMVPDPKDPTCCEVPQCIPIPGPGKTLPTGGPQTITGVPGVISGSGTPPAPTPDVNGFTSAPKNVCVYQGRMYTQGQKWQDGCKYDCICTDGMTGKYECTERCAAFPLVPPECKLQRDPNDVCCFVPVCDYNQTSPTLPAPVSPGVSTQLPPLPQSFCVYKGVPYSQGQTWDDGCQKKCRCDDADNNIYTCFDRCKSYNNLGTGCTMVIDPTDACCQVPRCTYIPTPAPQPGTTVNPPTVCPYPMPTAVPGVISGGPQPDPVTGVLPSNVGYCEYKGTQYRQGQSWDDGCSFVCSCIDSSSGQYQCTEKCPRYVGLPSYCTMAQDPNNKCCTKPACNVCPHTPAPVTGGPAPLSTPAPKEVCVMNGKQYTTGQKWYVGCDKYCVCDDGKTGAISCNDRCPSYPQQPGCTMVPDPRDPVCCLTPSCPGNTGVFGQVNGSGTPAPQMIPSPQPGSTFVPPSQPPKVCVYKGTMYTQGQKWQDGCQFECVCDDAMSGHYHCTDRCPRYPSLPSSCTLVYDPINPCCKKPECPTTPVPMPGQSPTPNPNPTPATQFCVYQGVPLRQGQTFNQGCDKVCKCEDAMTGKITCDDRCPTYPALTPNCTLTTDPNDQCCQIPQCTTKTGVVGVPGVISGSNLPTNNPYNPGTTGNRNGCVYGGNVYTQGQTWDDGCTYTCECLDASTGRYRCTEKCPRNPPLPSFCTLTQDPMNKCCQKPFCQPPTVPPSPSSVPNPSATPAPPQNVCVYKGSTYQQGQQWYDGCDYICRCEDSGKNFHNCKQRCAKFDSIQPGCTLVPDQKDPTCCQRPSCPLLPPTGPNPTPGIITAAPQPGGVITGVNPTPSPGSTNPGTRKGCVYKGQVFHQGDKFDDGCDYECECLDENTGQYKCVEKCQKYSSIPNECVLVQDPKKPCCQVPFCDFTNPTPFPGGVPTPAPAQTPSPKPGVITVAPYIIPGVTNTPRPGVNPSPTPGPTFTTAKPQGYCVYKGVYYTQGQTWDDGCDKRCRCEDVMKGYYTCNQRCASYPVSSCPLKADPADSCCLIPDCNTGKIPTPMPTPGPGQSTINPFITPKPISGSFTGNSGGNPVVVPFQPGTGSTGSSPACVYKGMIYTQGQQWNDGCSYVCECVDASRGQYKCNDRCPKYPYLPPQCHYKQSTTDACCQEPECNTYIQPSTQAPVITVQPGTGVGPSGTGPTIKPSTVCVFTNGMQYAQGATWQDGCDKDCRCTDAAKNIFECTEKCPVYSSLPSFCTLIPDPSNTCCKKPLCTLPSGQTLSPVSGTATPPPHSLQVLPVGTHVVINGYSKPQPGQMISGGRDQCVYKGSLHTQGTSWEDGCKFICTCENGKTGMYRCTSKCPEYPQLPNYCKSVTVPGQCCPTLTCDIPGYGTYNPVPQLVPTPRPSNSPSGSTPDPQIIVMPQNPVSGGHYPGGGYYLPNATRPDVTGSIRDKCVYKNQLYNQGETWNDGCDYKCQCMDSRTGYYVCNPLCPVYNNLPSNQCYLVKADGQCCSQPMCYDPNKKEVVNPLTSSSVFPVVGTYTGGFTGFRPYSSPGQTSGQSNACVYKGTVYGQNAKWDDGCDFTCTCLDEKQGMYSCSAKCPVYTNIPPVCRLEAQTGSCCKRVVCNTNPGVTRPPGLTPNPPTTAQPIVDPLCHDNINNCKDYGKDACGSIYKDWATRNCPMTCQICYPSFTTPQPQCIDKLSDCKDYGLQACSGIYEPWAQDNCRKFCGLCATTAPPFSGQPVITTPSPSGPCVDNLPSCKLLDTSFYCSGEYYGYALQNCRKTCNLCNETLTTTTVPAPVTADASKWMLFLKGVAGATGPDLYQLWHSSQTMNPNVPQAQTLTSEFKGHYKPDYSNHWKDLCIDKVKVAIYNNGVEKANIIFNAVGADKNSWFTSDRIISSTWTDIKTAQKEIFSLAGDANTGREFYVSGQSSKTDNCDSFGWIMVSTKSSCFYEAGDKKPTFYYAPGTSQAHWGFTNPGTGDVFAIQAHSQCPPGSVITQGPASGTGPTQAAVCEYKNKQYTQGQHWTDGCQYNCSCEDAAIGYYRCRNLCPVYSQIPPGCKLVQGHCCPTIDCPFSTQQPPITITWNYKAFCTYKGQYYTQAQTWNDGCSQSCTCTDADRGMYSCRAVCLNWNNLPSICHLEDPAPPLCCQQPKCPSGVIINIPKAYKDQYPGYSYV
ncbi:mucin-2-like isoform X2 [Ruditapes philippinarum]|uniref:mucin-2-like isoform X2 n=1 Tax=Ruditapes philippinarum TaxID=129788 RepID=UPI00295BB6AA|nr:mucin-2-like isoform X2 [Ruditapes philippinarum]